MSNSLQAQPWALFRPGTQNLLTDGNNWDFRIQYNRHDSLNGEWHYTAHNLFQPMPDISGDNSNLLHAGLLGRELINRANGIWAINGSLPIVSNKTSNYIIGAQFEPAGAPLLLPGLNGTDTVLMPVPNSKHWDSVYLDSVKTFILPVAGLSPGRELILSREHGILQYGRFTFLKPFNAEEVPTYRQFVDPDTITNVIFETRYIGFSGPFYISQGCTSRHFGPARLTDSTFTVPYTDSALYGFGQTYIIPPCTGPGNWLNCFPPFDTAAAWQPGLDIQGEYTIKNSDLNVKLLNDSVYKGGLSGSRFDNILSHNTGRDFIPLITSTSIGKQASFMNFSLTADQGNTDTLVHFTPGMTNDMPVTVRLGKVEGIDNGFEWLTECRLLYYSSSNGYHYGRRPVVSGLQEDRSEKIILYPNPSEGSISVAGLSTNATLTLIDALGRKTEYSLKPAQKLDLGNLPAGLYRYHLTGADYSGAEGKLVVR
ncbi:MAG: T9SS type A sorting domain-containing protein [Bacteroidota bacterium]